MEPAKIVRVADVAWAVGPARIVRIVNLARSVHPSEKNDLAIIAEIMDWFKVAAFVKNIDWWRRGNTVLQRDYPALAIESLTKSKPAGLDYEAPEVSYLFMGLLGGEMFFILGATQPQRKR